jgi:hypothetical protein
MDVAMCSLTLISVEHCACQMKTVLHSQEMPYMHSLYWAGGLVPASKKAHCMSATKVNILLNFGSVETYYGY